MHKINLNLKIRVCCINHLILKFIFEIWLASENLKF